MTYIVCKLKFSTPLHIGSQTGGGALDTSCCSICSDTLFSALCCEAAKTDAVGELFKYVNSGELVFSDALPYKRNGESDTLYLPKPVIYLPSDAKAQGDSKRKKAMKKLQYIPANKLNSYIKGIKSGDFDPSDCAADFGTHFQYARAAVSGLEQTLPYNVGCFSFYADCGLCVIFRGNESSLTLARRLMDDLGWSGIGGKTSSGLGKFEVVSWNEAKQGMVKYLDDDKAQFQMLLGTGLPAESEKQTLDGGYYAILRRGGFVQSDTYAQTAVRKADSYFLAAGSCLKNRFEGEVKNVGGKGAHPVWRCSKTLFWGIV